MKLMPLATLWESICRLAGDDGGASVNLDEAVDKSAVPKNVALVEVRRMIEDGLISCEDDVIQLTERGRKGCVELNSNPVTGSQTVAPE